MFIAALFIIARTWKQPRCPSADEWIRKQWYIYTMEYYSAIKKNTCESVLMRWMKLEPIIQSEWSMPKRKTPIQYTESESEVTQSCPTLCEPMNRSTLGLPVHHHFPEFTQTHVHRVSDATQAISSSVVSFSSCPQSLPASESFPMSQLFAWGGQSIGVSALASFLPKKSHLLLMYSAT